MYKIKKSFNISCAHFLGDKTNASSQELYGRCTSFHGHNYSVTLYLKSTIIDKTGMITNFTDLKDIFLKHIDKKYDHQLLNMVQPFDKVIPTAENMAKVFFDILKKYIPELYAVEIEETPSASAIYEEP